MCHLHFDVMYGNFKHIHGLSHDEVFSERDLARKRMSCATFEGKVMCILVKARSYATSEGKVV